MGCVDTIRHDGGPAQGNYLGKRVAVCFHYDASKQVNGVIVRDDSEAPFVTLIALDDGRYVLATECQYSPLPEPAGAH
jgi:hypothetical protein